MMTAWGDGIGYDREEVERQHARRMRDLSQQVDAYREALGLAVQEITRRRRRALHYHEHALREREARQRAEIERDDARQLDARTILANAVGCETCGYAPCDGSC